MSNRYANLMKLDDAAFRRVTGTKRCVFDKMLIIVHLFHFPQHKQGGAPNKIPLADKLLIALQYWREYRTFESIGVDYGVNRSTIQRIVAR
ncbi:MAG: transposase family protein [Planctomycetaceae bacterium]|jgi:hypothetical protein|nr:transposase family protein [Planctomycetaceae bacterium]